MMLARIRFAILVTIGVAVSAIIHYRAGVAFLYPEAKSVAGPYTEAVTALEVIAPLVLALAMVFAWGYVIYGVVQRERVRSVRRGVRRP
jgi:hypothetical protein